MARPEVTGRKLTDHADHAHAFGVREFCARYGISSQLFYKLKPLGLMPQTFNVGTRVLISREAADAWRRAREAATQTANSAA
ncbi:hypothetical protein AB8Z38_24575 [Bradyrhizobium sp. LLZ17]|uniref:Helix-turn-helix domain-containing protein n=1 Tax=Bradyrhizobium sp. LLZ17 TaxID=3239388 RepID=A0AB39XD57_9BRAD